jgi:legumain
MKPFYNFILLYNFVQYFIIDSGPADNIFINFVDHGAPGLLAFPSSELHARTLQDTLLDMYQRKQFAKLVLYIEACESGSMFEDLLSDNLNSRGVYFYFP